MYLHIFAPRQWSWRRAQHRTPYSHCRPRRLRWRSGFRGHPPWTFLQRPAGNAAPEQERPTVRRLLAKGSPPGGAKPKCRERLLVCLRRFPLRNSCNRNLRSSGGALRVLNEPDGLLHWPAEASFTIHVASFRASGGLAARAESDVTRPRLFFMASVVATARE